MRQYRSLKKSNCDNCGFDSHIEVFENPYCYSKPLTLCQKCAEIPFGNFINKDILKPWFEKEKSVKSFDAPTLHPEDDENFKKEHQALGVFMNEIHDKYHTT